MNRAICALLCASVFMAGCTSKVKNIQPEFVSPRLYSAFSCEELFEENRKIQDKVDDLVGRQKSNRTTDTVMTTVGIVIFWPALLALPFTKDRKREIARYMGEAEAIKENITVKKCAYRNGPAQDVVETPSPDTRPAPQLSVPGEERPTPTAADDSKPSQDEAKPSGASSAD